MKRGVVIFFIVIMILFCFLNGYQKQQKLLPPEKHEVIVRLILVDVIVTDKKGNFVTDLTKDDFELYEDGVKVPINSMDLISLEKAEFIAPEKKAVTPPSLLPREKRLIVIFDSINTKSRILKRSAPQIIEKLISLFKLGHEIMVLELTYERGMIVLQPFTRDEELLAKSVKKASGSIWREKLKDELEIASVLEDKAGPGQAKVERGHAEKVKEFMRFSNRYFEQKKLEKTLSGLLAVMNTIKNYPGRKTILLISDGVPSVNALKIFDPFNLLNKRGVWSSYEFLEALINFANSQNITFYTLDPDTAIRYLAPDVFTTSIDKGSRLAMQNLEWIAHGTGGVSLKGAKKFENFHQIIKRDLTYYYELSYYPRRKEADGKYHKIKVKVKRPGVKIRFREGYSDYSESQKEVLHLSSVSYNPLIFKQIPFEALAVPFMQKKDKFILWMNLGLSVEKLFLDNTYETTSKNLKLHIWLKNPYEERACLGQITIPLNLIPSFLEYIKNIDYLQYNYRTPELKLKKDEYQVVFTLYDEKSGKTGTVEQTLIIPDFENDMKPKIVSVALGNLSKNIEVEIKPFAISKKDGALQLSKHKFYPSAVNNFMQDKLVGAFFQLYSPKEEPEVNIKFSLFQEGEEITHLSGKIMDIFWNEKTKIWNGVFSLDISNIFPGTYILKIKTLISNLNLTLKKEIKLRIVL